MEKSLEDLVERAKRGDRIALEDLIGRIQDRVYALALRMLGRPLDAEDAAQEILIKIVTHLGTFRGTSAFTSWVYRVASNHLINTNKKRAEQRFVSLEAWEKQVQGGIARAGSPVVPEAERLLLVQETWIGCMQALLVGLNRALRLAYILGEILGITGTEGAYILDISAASFRKRLSRSRTLIRDFMWKNCGLVNPSNPCRCENQIAYAVETRCVDPAHLMFASHPRKNNKIGLTTQQLKEMDELKRVMALFRSHPDYTAPAGIIAGLKGALDKSRSHSPESGTC